MATLEYWRADNMWAAQGRPDGDLGKESLTVGVGQTRVFVTDWRYEKKRNDGTNYYGSHARRIRNASTDERIVVRLNGGMNFKSPEAAAVTMAKVLAGNKSVPEVTLAPGQQLNVEHDIMEVRALAPAPKQPTDKPPALAQPQPGIGRVIPRRPRP